MYDKEARTFRIEATIIQPHALRVFRTKENEAADAPKAWRPICKGIADLHRRAEVSHAANSHLAESVATVAESNTLGELRKTLGRLVQADGRRQARALNPLTVADRTLLRDLLRAHGVFVKVPTHRYQLSVPGRRMVTALLVAHASVVSQLTASA